MTPPRRRLVAELVARRDRALADATAAAAAGDVAGTVALDAALDDAARFADLADVAARVEVRSEPATYRPDGAHSFFADVANAGRDPEAADRLRRHHSEVADHERAAEARRVAVFDRRADAAGWLVEHRANMDRGTGTGGEFAAPVWLSDHTAQIPRSARVVAPWCAAVPLPDRVAKINVPVPTAGSSATIAADGATPSQTDMTTSTATSTVVTISGRQVAALQLVEQSSPAAFDRLMLADLTASYDAALDAQLLNGSGSSGQLLGLRNVSGIGTTTYTDASPTAAEMVAKVGAAAAAAATARGRRPQVAVGHPRRWYWTASAADSTGRPLAELGGRPPVDDDPSAAAGSWASLPVLTSTAVPTNLGAGTNEDVVVVCRPADCLLLEGGLSFAATQQTKAGTLEVVLSAYAYVAFLPHLYPSAVNVVGGTGLVTPTF